MINTKIRYRVDPYRSAIIDQKENMLVCEQAAAAHYFSKKKSKVREAVAELDAKIQELTQQKYKLQSRCRHTNAVAEYQADTGNWCKSDDAYWVDIRCYDCGHRWQEDQ